MGRILFPVHRLPFVIVIGMLKGGSGKTTTTVNLGTAFAEDGYSVGVRDGDQTSQSAYDWARNAAAAIEGRPATPLPFDVVRYPYGDIAEEIARMRETVDIGIIDAGGGDAGFLEEACTAADLALMTLAPSAADARRVAATMTAIERGGARNPRGLVACTAIVRADSRTSEPYLWQKQLEADGYPVLDTMIGSRVAYSRAYGTRPEPGEYRNLAAELGQIVSAEVAA